MADDSSDIEFLFREFVDNMAMSFYERDSVEELNRMSRAWIEIVRVNVAMAAGIRRHIRQIEKSLSDDGQGVLLDAADDAAIRGFRGIVDSAPAGHYETVGDIYAAGVSEVKRQITEDTGTL